MEHWIVPLTHGVGHNYGWTLCARACVSYVRPSVWIWPRRRTAWMCGGTTTLYYILPCSYTLFVCVCVCVCVYAIFSLYFVCERLSEALREHRGWSLPVPCLTGHSVAHTQSQATSLSPFSSLMRPCVRPMWTQLERGLRGREPLFPSHLFQYPSPRRLWLSPSRSLVARAVLPFLTTSTRLAATRSNTAHCTPR